MKNSVSGKINELSEGILSSFVDFSLWLVVYTAALSMPQSSSGQLYRAQREADRFLDSINYDSLKRGIAEARRKGLLKHGQKGRRSWPHITAAGKRRLAALFPKYDSQRIWDGRIYLITYDIPEKLRRDRDLLREYLHRFGCGKLQESVYMSPYDPREMVAGYVREHHLTGTIIISDIGEDGSIGGKTLGELVCSVYHLDDLNKRYKQWLEDIEKTKVDHWVVLQFLSILQDDPQLPFSLLPDWWLGDVAYKKVERYILKI